MTHPFKTGLLLLPLAVTVGCASVPDVESRLSTMQFYPNMYVVQVGDTLESIAYRYRLSAAEVAQLNPGVGSALQPGLRLNVRPGTQLSEAVRTRAGWQRDDAATTTVGASSLAVDTVVDTPVVLSRVTTPPPLSAALPDDGLLARADVARYNDYAQDDYAPDALAVNAPGYPIEEIVPDDIDISNAGNYSTVDQDLQRYVGRWTWPTDGAVARRFAPEEPGGQGVDIAGVPGQDVRAALDGQIVYSGRDLSGGGNLVIVRHDDELMTTYSHTDNLFVAEDDVVLAGDPIASLGWNGNQESVLRFEVRRDGQPLDPMVFLPPTR